MNKDRRCAVISLGNELTNGAVQDTHLSYLGKELTRLAITINKHIIIPDDIETAARELTTLIEEYPLLIVTGGLGPTSDDITREAMSIAVDTGLEFHSEIWETIEHRFSGRKIAESNKKQAEIPKGFAIIENKWGTAPGFTGMIKGCRIVVLPGPPRELTNMFDEYVMPLLRENFGFAEHKNLELCIYLVGESDIEDEYSRFKESGVMLHTRLAEDRVIVTLDGDDRSIQEEIFLHFEKTFGPFRVRRPDKPVNRLLFDALSSRGSSIAFAESCTGGLVSKWITDIPGASEVFWGGIVTYSNDSKMKLLGVDAGLLKKEGAVSRSVVEQMALFVLEKSGADYSVAISGIAGPGGGTDEKPVGTVWISAWGKKMKQSTRKFLFTGSQEWIRRKSTVCAFLLAEYFISEKEGLDIVDKW